MRILCLGEFLIDRSGDSRWPGGAPANVACHAAALGCAATLVSRVGCDDAGRELKDWLGRRGVTGFLQFDKVQPTASVEVLPGPRYEIAAPAAWDFIEVSEENCSAAEKSSVVVFGTLAQRYPVSRGTIRSLVERARDSGAVAIADLNLRAPFFDEEVIVWTLRNCDLLKLNREELSVVSRILGANGDTITLFDGLLREFGLSRAVLTCGAEGAWFFDAGRKWHQPAVAALVVDPVGAGDAFTVVLAAALAKNVPLAQAAPAAAEVASYVVSQPGAMPVWLEALRERVRSVLDTPA